MTSRIQQLPEQLSEMIAAGEVIERPASALKELIENSIDAGAREIAVRVLKGGKVLLEVDDDGNGIHPDDLPIAIARHATSKLHTADDLLNIRTLGFRGEALASLAAVADLTIESKAETADAGAGLSIAPGQSPTGPYPVGRTRGTRVIVERLFSALPARRKFLRSDQSESQKIRDVVKISSVANPEIGFRYTSGDRVRLNVPPASLDQRLAELYDDIRWINVEAEGTRFRLTALLSGHHQHRGNGNDLFIFVNRRFVRDPLLRKAVQSAYEAIIPPGRWPVGAVFVDVLPGDIDVNVHPAKTEIRFLNPAGMFSEIRGAIRDALSGARRPPGSVPSADERSDAISEEQATAAPAPHDRPYSNRPTAPTQIATEAALEFREPTATQPNGAPLLDATPNLQPLGDIGERYLLFKEEDQLILVDQHAAHERVRYDRIVAAFEASPQPSQELLAPETFHAEPAEMRGLRIGGEWLARMGFDVETFGPETLRIRTVPKWFQGDPKPAVRETLQQIAAYGSPEALRTQAHDIAASLACKGAILSGRNVPLAEQAALMQQLLETPGAETCPHGRPTYRRMTMQELDRWFGR